MQTLLLLGMLCCGQTEPVLPGQAPPEAVSAQPDAAKAPRWLLMEALQGTWEGEVLNDNRILISGWTDLVFTASTAQTSNLPMAPNDRANELTLAQNWLRIERPPLLTGTTAPSFGFRSDWILPGTDYRINVARGLFDEQLTASHGRPNLYGIDPIQFYLEAYVPGWANGVDITVGRFYGLFGMEYSEPISNLLISFSYVSLGGVATHTGEITTIKLSPEWSLYAGLVLGNDVFIDPADQPTFTGGVAWAQPGRRNAATFGVVLQSGRFDSRLNAHHANLFDLVYTHRFSTALTYSVEALFGYEAGVPEIGTACWGGAANYFTWTFSPRLRGTTRLELFEDAEGHVTGFRGLFAEATAGLTFRPTRSLMLRTELRYDYNLGSHPFEGRTDLLTLGTDAIFRW